MIASKPLVEKPQVVLKPLNANLKSKSIWFEWRFGKIWNKKYKIWQIETKTQKITEQKQGQFLWLFYYPTWTSVKQETSGLGTFDLPFIVFKTDEFILLLKWKFY